MPRPWPLLLLLVAPPCLAAQDRTPEAVLPDIVVSATRAPLPASALASSVTVLDADSLRRRGVRLLHEALADVPGLAVVEAGSFGAVTSLFLRGGESDYVKVMLDGVPLNEPGGSIDLAAVSLDNIARVEIVRGPASLTHGADAVSGVVNLVSRQGERRVAVGIEGGSYALRRVHAAAAGSSGAVGWSLAGSSMARDGVYDVNSGQGSDVADAALTLAGGAGRARVHARLARHRVRFPTDGSGAVVDLNQRSWNDLALVSLDLQRSLGGHTSAEVRAAGSRTVYAFDDRADGPDDSTGFAFAAERHAVSRRGTLEGILRVTPGRALSLAGGAALVGEWAERSGRYASDFGGGAVEEEEAPLDATRRTAAFFGEAAWSPISTVDAQGGVRLDESPAHGAIGTWRLGVAWRPRPASRIRASAGVAFRAPSFAESYAMSPFEVGNPALEPERTRSWELGADQALAEGRVRLSAVLFDQRFRDMIQYAFTSDSEPSYFNLGAARARGLETTLTVALPRVTVGLAHTWLSTEVTDAGASASPAFADGASLIRRPASIARLAVDGHPARGVVVSAGATRTGRRDDMDFRAFPAERVTLPAHLLVDLGVRATVAQGAGTRPQLDVMLRVVNALDEAYEPVVGFPAPGRQLLAGVTAGW